VAAFLMLAGPVSVTRAAADDLATCHDASGDEAIAACTRATSSGRYHGHDLAHAYMYRCDEYVIKGDSDRAIADCTEAIRLDPKLSMAYNNRGDECRLKKDFDRAIQDLNAAVRLDPTHAQARSKRDQEQQDRKN
jgi:tetratricopeptide (TPR) repeat protein